jgi:hypothetical protein
MNMEKFLIYTTAVCIGAAVIAVVWWLWNNCLVGALDGVHEIGILQAWGITFLLGILFKSSVSRKE